MPLYNTTHRWKDRVKRLWLPLFPNYVFVFACVRHRTVILRAPGVRDFVRRNGLPAPIPVEEIDGVRRILEDGLSVEPHPFLKLGNRIRLRSGPLQGLEGILVRKKNLFRLVISVELLSQAVAVEVDAADVERVAGGDAGNRYLAKCGIA